MAWRTFFSEKVVALRLLVISSRRGCLHVPGESVTGAPLTGVALAGVAIARSVANVPLLDDGFVGGIKDNTLGPAR